MHTHSPHHAVGDLDGSVAERPSADVPGMLVRVGVIAAAAVAATAGAPVGVTAPLAALACLVVFESVIARWGAGPLDGPAIAVGGLLSALVLIGLALDVVPGGLTRPGWAIATAWVGAAVVLYARPPRPNLAWLRTRRLAPRHAWYVAGLAVVVAGLLMSVAAQRHATAAPVALDVSSTAGTVTIVQVTSSRPSGLYTLVEDTGTGPRVLLTGIRVAAGAPVSYRLATVPRARVTVRLVEGSSPYGVEARRLIIQAP